MLGSFIEQGLIAVCGQVWLEYLGGFKRWADRERARRLFNSFEFLETTKHDFDLAAELRVKYSLGYGDLSIAAVSIRNSVSLMTFDRDFKVLEQEGLKLILIEKK